MLVSLTVGKVDAGVTVLLTPDKRLIEFPSILLPPDISSGSIVDITVSRNTASERAAEQAFRALQDRIYASFGAAEPAAPVLRCRNATQTSVVLEWDPIQLATADLISLAMYRNGQKAGNIPRPLQMHSTKISGLAVDTEYTFHLVLRTTAGTRSSERVVVRTHKMTDLSGITITTGIMPASVREGLARAVERVGAKMVDGVRIDTTHFVTTEGRGLQWEKAVEMNIPVVRPEWVEACEKNGRILGVTKFYLDALRPGPPTPSVEEHHQSPGGGAAPHARSPSQAQQQAAAAAAAAGAHSQRPDKELPTPPADSREAAGEEAAKASSSHQDAEKKSPDEAPAQKNKEEAVEGDEDEESEEDDESEESSSEAPEPASKEKDKSAVQEEQKMRLDEKDGSRPQQQKALAQRPKEKEKEGEENGGGGGGSGGGELQQPGREKAAASTTTADGASFQDVEL